MENTCEHRQGDGAATAEDLEKFRAGDECPECGCYLGADGYWYIEREQAPSADGGGDDTAGKCELCLQGGLSPAEAGDAVASLRPDPRADIEDYYFDSPDLLEISVCAACLKEGHWTHEGHTADGDVVEYDDIVEMYDE